MVEPAVSCLRVHGLCRCLRDDYRIWVCRLRGLLVVSLRSRSDFWPDPNRTPGVRLINTRKSDISTRYVSGASLKELLKLTGRSIEEGKLVSIESMEERGP